MGFDKGTQPIVPGHVPSAPLKSKHHGHPLADTQHLEEDAPGKPKRVSKKAAAAKKKKRKSAKKARKNNR